MATINEPAESSVGTLAGASGAWQLDPSATTIVLRSKVMWGLAKVRAVFKATEGSATVGADGNVTGTLVIDASSVDTKNKRRDKHLRGSRFFEVETYPTFTYAVTGARPAAGSELVVTGRLSVHGGSRPLDVPVAVATNGRNKMIVTGAVEIDRSQWGLTWGAKMGVGRYNHVTVAAVFTRA